MLEKSGVRLRLPASYPVLSAPLEGESVLSPMHGASPEDQDPVPPLSRKTPSTTTPPCVTTIPMCVPSLDSVSLRVTL